MRGGGGTQGPPLFPIPARSGNARPPREGGCARPARPARPASATAPPSAASGTSGAPAGGWGQRWAARPAPGVRLCAGGLCREPLRSSPAPRPRAPRDHGRLPAPSRGRGAPAAGAASAAAAASRYGRGTGETGGGRKKGLRPGGEPVAGAPLPFRPPLHPESSGREPRGPRVAGSAPSSSVPLSASRPLPRSRNRWGN